MNIAKLAKPGKVNHDLRPKNSFSKPVISWITSLLNKIFRFLREMAEGAAYGERLDFAGWLCCQNAKTSFHHAGDCPAMSLWWAPGMV